MVAEHVAQRAVQQVRARVVRDRRAPPRRLHERADLLAAVQLALVDADRQGLVAVEAVDGLDHGAAAALALEHAGVGDLAAALGVERRLAQLHEQPAVAEVLDGAGLGQHVDRVVAAELGPEAGVAHERGEALGVGPVAQRAAARARRRCSSMRSAKPVSVEP